MTKAVFKAAAAAAAAHCGGTTWTRKNAYDATPSKHSGLFAQNSFQIDSLELINSFSTS
jgi:hypothetical protein